MLRAKYYAATAGARETPSARRSRMSTFNVALALGGLLLALAACSPSHSPPCDVDADCPEGRCRFGACGPACLDDFECGAGERCAEGTCAERPQCAASSDCASGFTCEAGRCACASDAACASNQSCQRGQCVTPSPCRRDDQCLDGKRCEVTQGLCLPPCSLATDCAPGVDPAIANALYFCQVGSCHRRCLNDATCGAGLVCRDGLCATADCATFTDCRSGSYCTDARFGRCVPYTPCATAAECEPNFTCAPFDPAACPPGFPCEQPICQELPRCFIDGDCAAAEGPSYCADGHCQRSTACVGSGHCSAEQACVANVCVPGGCRGHSDCPIGQMCTDGACAEAPPASDVRTLMITPRSGVVAVGDSLELDLIAFRFNGSSYPLQSATWEVLDAAGDSSSAATIDADGTLTATSPGSVRVRASLDGASAPPVEATLELLPALAAGERRVVVIDLATRLPVAGALVTGCDATPISGPCPAPVSVVTGAAGVASFPGFSGGAATFTAGSEELRADGLPRYELVSVVDTQTADLLIPLGDNPVQAAAGFTASISFTETHGSGDYWIGFGAPSLADLPKLDLRRLLGDAFMATFPQTGTRFPLPGSVVAYQAPAFGLATEIKGRVYALGESGRRMASGFGGKTQADQLLRARSTELLAYAGAFDYAVEPPFALTQRPLVPDTGDLDGDGLCADPERCPQGTESLPAYLAFPQVGFIPRREQQRRTEVILPPIPGELDTVVLTAVETLDEGGAVPLGFSSRNAGPADPQSGMRPVEPVLLRSGAPYAGAELGRPGILAMAVAGGAQSQSASPSNATARLSRDGRLPTRVTLPPFLPLASGSSYTPATRTLTTAQPQWNAVVSAGASLGRVDITGSKARHVVWFPAASSQTALQVPLPAPTLRPVDPASEPARTVEIIAIALQGGGGAEDAFALSGANLSSLHLLLSGYSRFVAE